jgi:hypothetical protein
VDVVSSASKDTGASSSCASTTVHVRRGFSPTILRYVTASQSRSKHTFRSTSIARNTSGVAIIRGVCIATKKDSLASHLHCCILQKLRVWTGGSLETLSTSSFTARSRSFLGLGLGRWHRSEGNYSEGYRLHPNYRAKPKPLFPSARSAGLNCQRGIVPG